MCVLTARGTITQKMTTALPLAAFVISASPVGLVPSLARTGYLRAPPPKARGDRTNDVRETTRAHAVDYDTMGNVH